MSVRERHGIVCSECGASGRRSVRWDAYYCKRCNVWLERQCNDPMCYLCDGRPVTPRAAAESGPMSGDVRINGYARCDLYAADSGELYMFEQHGPPPRSDLRLVASGAYEAMVAAYRLLGPAATPGAVRWRIGVYP